MMRGLILLTVALVASAAVFAQEQPIVRIKVSPETVNVGEHVELTVTVLVPTWFTRPSNYPSFELANAITRLPADSSFNIRERVGNDSWPGIVRTYEIYPLLGASYRLAGQLVEVTYASPGEGPLTTAVELPEVVFRGGVPVGAERLEPYIAGKSLSLSLNVTGDLDALDVGDAVVLEYVAELDGLPAIFIPPLAPNLQLDGVSIYADGPDVQDGTRARRSEKLTLVFDAGGEFRIPGREINYWNMESKSVETATSEGIVLSVAGPPLPPPADDTARAISWAWLAALFAGTVLLLVVAWRRTPRIASWYRETAERQRQTESYAFTRLSKALASGDDATAYYALLDWIQRLAPGTDARSFASAYGDDTLSTEVSALSAGMYSDAGRSADLRLVRKKLKAARKHYLERGAGRQASSLPSLNP